jgi:hypothetical protein
MPCRRKASIGREPQGLAAPQQPEAQGDGIDHRPIDQSDAWNMIRRRAAAAGIHAPIGTSAVGLSRDVRG